MNKKWMFGTLATLLFAVSLPMASAGSGPHATVVLVPQSFSCQVSPVFFQMGDLTITVSSTCVVTVDYYDNMFLCRIQPQTVSTGRLTIQVNYDCSVVATAKV